MERWHVVSCKQGLNNQDTAEYNLFRQSFEVYNPKITIEKIRKGILTRQHESFFPGYMFIKFDPLERSASTINSTFGVRKLVTFGGKLATISASSVMEIRRQLDLQPKNIAQLHKGDEVEIKTGSMAGLKAIYLEPNGITRSYLLINLLGTTRQINVDNKQLA